jgi:hypothetical protein
MRVVLSSVALVFGLALSCGTAVAGDDDSSGAMQQLQNATSGNQTLEQTYGDQGHGESCPDACPSGNTNVPDPPPPTPVDDSSGPN